MAEKESPYVVWVPEKPKVLRVTRFHDEKLRLTDPITGAPKMVDVMTCQVDMEDWQPVTKTWGVTSKKLKATLMGLDRAGKFIGHALEITAHGYGFRREYSVYPAKKP